MTQMKRIQNLAGQEPPPKRKRYMQTEGRLRAVTEDYHNRDQLDFLRSIAHNWAF